jgi:hypothetical protein
VDDNRHPACKPNRAKTKPMRDLKKERAIASQTFDDHRGWIGLEVRMIDWRDAKVDMLTHAFHDASAVSEGKRLRPPP